MRRSIIVAAFEEARRQGDAAAMCRTAAALARHDERIVRRIAPFIGFVAAVVLILTVLLTAHVALGSTPVPAVGQLAAWSTDTVPSVSVPSPIRVATPPPPGVPGGDGGGQASGVPVRSTGTSAPESSPSDPPPLSGPDDGEGGGDAPTGDGGVGPSSPSASSPPPPLDEVWTCGDTTAGVATWLNAHATYTDLTSDSDCARGGPDSAGDGLSDGSGPPPTTTAPPYEGPVVLCEHPDIGSGTHIGATCPDGWSPLGEPTVRTTTTTTVYEGPVIYCEHPQIGSGGFRAEVCPDGWTEMTS